jgi:mono/diheme cytochrome c family protein
MKELRATISNSGARGPANDRGVSARESRRGGAATRCRALVIALLSVVCISAAGCRQDMQDQPRYEVYESSKFFADGQASRPYVEGTIARGHLKDDRFFYQGKNSAGQQGASGAGGQALNAGGAQQGTLQTTMPNAQGGAAAVPGGDVNVRGNAGGRVGAQGGEIQSQAGRDAVNEFPFPVTKEVLDRGQERYQIYCSMCHGLTGYGDGMIVRRGFRRPPSYHDERLRSEPVGHFFDVITNGWGAMPDYSAQIPPADRWAIIAYLRALQLSQQAPASQVSPEMRARGASSSGSGAGAQQQGSGGEHK